MRYNLFNDMHEEIKKGFNELEQEDMQLSSDIFYGTENGEKKLNPYCFLYHGVRFDDNMKKLENIFKTKKLLAGKYTDNYYDYGDNANKGEYVSLIGYNSERHSDFSLFILENISFLVSPKCDAYLTKYVSFDEWDKLKDKTSSMFIIGSLCAETIVLKDGYYMLIPLLLLVAYLLLETSILAPILTVSGIFIKRFS